MLRLLIERSKINMSEQLLLSSFADSTLGNPYDVLLDKSWGGDVDANIDTANSLRQPTDRERFLFEPVEVKEHERSAVANYDQLFSDDALATHTVEGAAVRLKNGRRITAASEAESIKAAEQARASDSSLHSLFTDYLQQHSLPVEKLPLALRTDPDLRLRCGVYLADKLRMQATLPTMPRRIRNNTQKSPDVKGYEQYNYLTSQEYAVLLALSMLDGTFSREETAYDPVDYDPSTGEGGGQHRYVAQRILTN